MKLHIGAFGVTLFAAALWGLSGTAAQILFQKFAFPPFGLVMIRCLVAGIILLALFRPKWPKKSSVPLIVFAVLGVLPSQIFYFITIAHSNIVTALLLQYLFLPMIVLYEVLRGQYRLNAARAGSITLAMVGVLLLVLGGSGGFGLSVTPIALVSGVLSALGVMSYTLVSRPLVAKHGSWEITTWGFVIVGLVSIPFGIYSFAQSPPMVTASTLPMVLLLVLIVAIAGTLLAYGLFLRGLVKLSGSEVAVAASTEPIFAAIASFAVFGAVLSGLQYIGGALMIIAVMVLRSASDERKKIKKEEPMME